MSIINFIKSNKKCLLYFIPCIVIPLLILLIQFAYFIFDLIVSSKLIKTINDKNFDVETLNLIKDFLASFDNQYITLGLEIVGIAISVWIGLNIYNIIKRDSITDLIKRTEETEKRLNEFHKDYISFNLISLENAIVKEDRINFCFLEKFKDFATDELDYKTTKYIVLIEKTLQNIITRYDSCEYTNMDLYLKEYENELSEIKKCLEQLYIRNEDNYNIVKGYVNCRYADFHYYTGLKLYKTNKLDDAVSFLTNAEYYYKVTSQTKFDDITSNQILKSYINNTCSFINHTLYIIKSRSKNDVSHYVESAYDYSKKACSNLDDFPINTGYSRDHRNYGVNNEHYVNMMYKNNNTKWIECMFDSMHQYLIALDTDKNDVNTLTSITSCCLKIFDKIIGITNADYKTCKSILNCENVRTKLHEFNYNKCILNSLNKIIDKAYNCILLSQINAPLNISTHYHALHIYMYLYLITESTDEAEYYKKKGIEEINICNTIFAFSENIPPAFLYKARNFYCAIDDTTKADIYNNRIDFNKKQQLIHN